jgi:hypothetical protein
MKPDLPPFLIVYAERDLPTLGLQAIALDSALKGQKSPTKLLRVAGRNHANVMWKAKEPGDPVFSAALELIRKRAD